MLSYVQSGLLVGSDDGDFDCDGSGSEPRVADRESKAGQ